MDTKKDRARALREMRRARGLCWRCGQRPATDGRTSCEPCAQELRFNSRMKYRRRAKAEGRVLTRRRCPICSSLGHYSKTCPNRSKERAA